MKKIFLPLIAFILLPQMAFSHKQESFEGLQKKYDAMSKECAYWKQNSSNYFQLLDQHHAFLQKMNANNCKDLKTCQKIWALEMTYKERELKLMESVADEYHKFGKLVNKYLFDCNAQKNTAPCRRVYNEIVEMSPQGIEE